MRRPRAARLFRLQLRGSPLPKLACITTLPSVLLSIRDMFPRSLVKHLPPVTDIQRRVRQKIMAQVQGHCDDTFVQVKEVFQKSIDDGEELGASITVNIDGRNVMDLWGGYSEESCTAPWEKDTITNVWSRTKAVTNLAALMLIDRGQLDAFAKWPHTSPNLQRTANKISRSDTYSPTHQAWPAGNRLSQRKRCSICAPPQSSWQPKHLREERHPATILKTKATLWANWFAA
uniref:Esterase STE1 n=1 Tax=Coccidioides posadasii RMSCC 3488 TaxID=454284 RepID=A0A0J6FHV3_COCPO|nr:esterase STE1 [Coccidioides posadasii RMSCC 3488]